MFNVFLLEFLSQKYSVVHCRQSMFITAQCSVILSLFNSDITNRTSADEHGTDSSLSCYSRQTVAGLGVLNVRGAPRPGMAQLGLFPPLLVHGSSALKQCQGPDLVILDVVLGAPGFQYWNSFYRAMNKSLKWCLVYNTAAIMEGKQKKGRGELYYFVSNDSGQ